MKKIKYVLFILVAFFIFDGNVNAASKTINDGVYTITSAINDKSVVDVSGGKYQNNTNIQLYADNFTNAQKWQVTYLKNGYYKITSIGNKSYSLDVKGAGKKNGTNVQLYKANNTNAQQWIIKSAGDGYYYIVSRCNNLYLDIKGGKSKNKTNIQMYKGNKSKAQKFIFSPVVTGKKTIEDGDYIISNSSNDNYVLDLTGGKVNNKTNIQLYQYTGSKNQHWHVKYLNNGYYTISSVHNNNYVFDVNNGSKKNRTNLQLYKSNNTNAQQFVIKEIGNGNYNIISKINGLGIDISGGKIANKTNIQLYTNSSSNKSQQFKFTKVVNLKTPKMTLNTGVGINDKGYEFTENTFTIDSTDEIDGVEYYRASEKNGKYSTYMHSEDKRTVVTTRYGENWYLKARTYKMVHGAKIYSNYSNVVAYGNKLSAPKVEILSGIGGAEGEEPTKSYYLYMNNIDAEKGLVDGMDIYYQKNDKESFQFIGSENERVPVRDAYTYTITKEGNYKVRSYIMVDGVKMYSDYSTIVNFPNDIFEYPSEEEDPFSWNAIYSEKTEQGDQPIEFIVEDDAIAFDGVAVYSSLTRDGEYTLVKENEGKKAEIVLSKNQYGYYKMQGYTVNEDGTKEYSKFTNSILLSNIEFNMHIENEEILESGDKEYTVSFETEAILPENTELILYEKVNFEDEDGTGSSYTPIANLTYSNTCTVTVPKGKEYIYEIVVEFENYDYIWSKEFVLSNLSE